MSAQKYVKLNTISKKFQKNVSSKIKLKTLPKAMYPQPTKPII
jgi:hypothetical protein